MRNYLVAAGPVNHSFLRYGNLAHGFTRIRCADWI